MKEMFILFMGPLFQCIGYVILKSIFSNYVELIREYHVGILLFNMLPIYPLDGGKLLNILLCYISPYKKSLTTSILISYIVILLLVIINIGNIGLNIIIVSVFLSYKVYREYKDIDYTYERFLLERYLYNYKYKKSKIIDNKDSFYKDRRHVIKNENKYLLEKEYLENLFKIS